VLAVVLFVDDVAKLLLALGERVAGWL
jgi:hypothetical protein